MSDSTIFERFKQERLVSPNRKSIPPVYFQLVFQKKIARLVTVDDSHNSLTPDYRNYGGVTRGVLKALSMLEKDGNRTISWGKEEAGVNLSTHSFLLWQLKRCDNFVDETGRSITFSDRQGTFVLLIEGDRQLECRLGIRIADQHMDRVNIVSELHAFHDGVIYPVVQAGVDHATLCSFETLILPSELEKYLSLFCSYCPGVEIYYRDYEVQSGAELSPKPALVIDKITPDNSLYLKVVRSIPGYDPEFAEQFDLSVVAVVDDSEKSIEIRKIADSHSDLPANSIRKRLNQLKAESEDVLEFYQDGGFFIVENPLSELFVRDILPTLLPEYAVYGSDKLQAYKMVISKPELELSLEHGIDFLEGSADLVLQGERFSLFEALHQFRKKAYIQLTDGTRSVLDHEYVQKLERIFQKSNDEVKVSFFDLPLIGEMLEKRVRGERYEAAQEIYRGFSKLNDQSIDEPMLEAELRPYQKDGYKWLKYLHQNSLGGCLADDMGLGKTLQAIALLSSIYPDETLPSLVIVPRSLVFNWVSEVDKFCPSLQMTVYHGPGRNLQSACSGHLVLSTYGTVRSDIEQLKDRAFYYLILDESQTIKNHDSQISRAVSILQAKYRLALSGTPIENNLGELYSLFRFLNPTMFGNLARFNRQYLVPIQHAGNREVAGELKKKIYPFILRRLKKDVLQELPDKIEKTVYVEMNETQRRFYEQRRLFYYDAIRNRIESEGFKKSQFFVLQAITVLRQIASIPEVKTEGQILSPKREFLLESLDEALANEHKVLVFANFLGVLEYIANDLQQKGIDFETMTGATRNREAPVKRFQSDSDCRVFLMTLKAGGQGLNLTAADTIYIFDPWWNLAAENQAIDRSHRIGQNKTVFSYKLITKDTIEERILHLQHKKKAIFETIISDESMSFQDWGEEDVDYLMG